MEVGSDKKLSGWVKAALICGICILAIFLSVLLLQTVWAHRHSVFVPDTPMIDLSDMLQSPTLTEADYETLFLQTGLGRSAVLHLLSQGAAGKEQILSYQTAFYARPDVRCIPLLSWFTREDRIIDESGNIAAGPAFADLQYGDIILTLSTHSLGWHHGHAGLVMDPSGNGITLECAVLGTDSVMKDAHQWRQYSTYAVLRIKDVTPEMQKAVVYYANQYLIGVPYRLAAGFLGEKAQDSESEGFGLHCSYLVWYAWNAMGFDTDSDGGRLVSTSDILDSDQVEVVQIYGIDPQRFLN